MAIDLKKIKEVNSDKFPWASGRVSSQIGGRAENQDSWGTADTPFGFIVVVCDGMGGGPAGALASSIAVETIIKSVLEARNDEARINIVIKAIRMANEAIIERGMEDPMLQGMGSTCTVLLVNDQSAIAAYVGDSRIYQLEGNYKKWRTFDHSMVFGLVKQGVITEEQARLSAQSNVITRALGIKLDVEVDAFELPFVKNDRFVLTTDGVHGSMPEKQLIKILSDHKTRRDVLMDNLVQDVEKIGITAGGHHDNHTVAIVDVKKQSKLKENMSKRMKRIFCVLGILLAFSIGLNIYQWVVNKPVEEAATEQVEGSATDQNDNNNQEIAGNNVEAVNASNLESNDTQNAANVKTVAEAAAASSAAAVTEPQDTVKKAETTAQPDSNPNPTEGTAPDAEASAK